MTTPDRHEPEPETTSDTSASSAVSRAVTAAGSWPNAPTHPVCRCSHGVGLHNIRANGSRGACSVSRGPKATPCPCKSYEEAT